MNPKLPAGEVLHDLLHTQGMTLSQVGKRYGVTRQAVHKLYKNWAESHDVEWRRRPSRNASKGY